MSLDTTPRQQNLIQIKVVSLWRWRSSRAWALVSFVVCTRIYPGLSCAVLRKNFHQITSPKAETRHRSRTSPGCLPPPISTGHRSPLDRTSMIASWRASPCKNANKISFRQCLKEPSLEGPVVIQSPTICFHPFVEDFFNNEAYIRTRHCYNGDWSIE